MFIKKEHISVSVSLFNSVFRHMFFDSLIRKNDTYVDYSLEFTKNCIDKAVKWILVHQKLQPDGGITATVRFSKGKLIISGSYPEVTGYIIPTLFDYASLFRYGEAFDAAIKAAEFEIPFQNSLGYFPGGFVGNLSGPSVFNSAQIVHGLVRAYKETDNTKYIDSAIRACDWICEVQETDGSWGRFNYLDMRRVYDTKVCQALLEAGDTIGSDKYLDSANRNLSFVLSNQKDNGWFFNCDNSVERNAEPLTHTIGYTVQGLLECYYLTNNNDLLRAASNTLNALLHKFELENKLLSGRYIANWCASVNSSCITGNAQISLCWLDMYNISGNFRYINAALKMNDFLKGLQYNCKFIVINGALPSSYPFWGDYNPYVVNSWGVKYFIDALISEYKFKRSME